jgi:hypothetical protein
VCWPLFETEELSWGGSAIVVVEPKTGGRQRSREDLDEACWFGEETARR